MRLLIAEDDLKLLKSLKHIFEMNHYLVDAVSNGNDALAYAQAGEHDGFIFDIMMPGLDGIQVVKKLRACNIYAPVLFLTAKGDICSRIEGLDAGADDYLPKPFATGELLARVRAMLRRREQFLPDLLTAYDLTLNRSTSRLHYQNSAENLSKKEFQIMEMLMERQGFIITPDQFMAHIWGYESDVELSVIWVHISNLRKKLVKLQAPVEILFVRSAGYLLEYKK